MKKTNQNKKGFTLTELIVVIVIIGILAAVLIPSITGYVDKARRSAAEQEMNAVLDIYDNFVLEAKVGNISKYPANEFREYYAEVVDKKHQEIDTYLENFKIDTKKDQHEHIIKPAYLMYEYKKGKYLKMNIETRETTIMGDNEYTLSKYPHSIAKVTVRAINSK